MNRKFKVGAMLLLAMGMLSGCADDQMTLYVPTDTNKEVQVSEHIEVTDEMLLDLFSKYFSLTEEDMLVLNQHPTKVDENYKESYKVYAKKVQDLLGDTISDSAIIKLASNYATSDFHLPKKLELNGYVTYDVAKVEQVSIDSVQYKESTMVYEVSVTTLNKVETTAEANKKYTWDDQKGYYAQTETPNLGEPAFASTIMLDANLEKSILYAQSEENDEIRLKHKYWVEVTPDKTLKVESIKEVTTINLDGNIRQKAKNTSHIERLPYYKLSSDKDQKVVRQAMESLLFQTNDFFKYYDMALDTSYQTFLDMWEKDLSLKGIVNVDAASYKNAFSKYINPYKDNIQKLVAYTEQMTLTSSVFSTKLQPRYSVKIPVTATLVSNQPAYFVYTYQIGIENEQIEFIEFDNLLEISEDEFKALTEIKEEVAPSKEGQNSNVEDTNDVEDVDVAQNEKDTPNTSDSVGTEPTQEIELEEDTTEEVTPNGSVEPIQEEAIQGDGPQEAETIQDA